MGDTTQATVRQIWRFPMKGLAGEQLSQVELQPGEALPYDRGWAIENGAGKFDPAAPKFLPKIAFLMLMRDERMATLGTAFDEETTTLTILRDGKPVAKGDLSQSIGRTMLEQFFAAYMKDELRGAPKIVSAPGHTFSDMNTACAHIINLATIREIEQKVGEKIDPLRFRANLLIDGIPAWEEFNWIDRRITIGATVLRGLDRTERCDATNVNPETATRDMSLPRQLQRHYGHADVGIYATVKEGGVLQENASVEVAT